MFNSSSSLVLIKHLSNTDVQMRRFARYIQNIHTRKIGEKVHSTRCSSSCLATTPFKLLTLLIHHPAPYLRCWNKLGGGAICDRVKVYGLLREIFSSDLTRTNERRYFCKYHRLTPSTPKTHFHTR